MTEVIANGRIGTEATHKATHVTGSMGQQRPGLVFSTDGQLLCPYTCTLLNYAIILDCVWAKLNICNGDCARVQLIVHFDHLQIVYPVNYHFAKAGAM